MSSATTLREFLVSLGFKVDASSFKTFTEGAGKAGAVVGEMAEAVVAATVAVEAFVGKMAESLTDLYWSSQRLHSGVAAIKGFQLGVQQMGGDAASALTSLEGLANFMRSNPGGERFINSMLGVQTRGANGQLRATTEIMADIGAKLRQLPFYRQKVIANFLGIDDMTLMAMDRGLGKVTNNYAKLFKMIGTDPDKAALKLKDFYNQLERIEAIFYVLAVALAEKLLPVVTWLNDQFEHFVENFDTWKKSDWGKSVMDLADALGELTKDIISGSKAFDAWFHPLRAITDQMKIFIDELTLVIDILTLKWDKAGQKFKDVIKDYQDAFDHAAETFHKFANAGQGSNGHGGKGSAPTPSITTAGKQAGVAAIGYLQKIGGWTKEQAAGIVGNLLYEGGLKADTKGDGGAAYGIGQWHKDRQELFKKWSGHDIHNSTLVEQLGFVNYELHHSEARAGNVLGHITEAALAAIAIRKLYERPASGASDGARAGIAERLLGGKGGHDVTIHQKTDIHVNGAHDPATTAKRTSEQQSRVNGNLVRNFRTAVAG